MRICYRGDFTACSGYARASRAHARALIEAGVDLTIENHTKDKVQCVLDSFWKEELPKRLVPNHHKADVVIWHETPEFYDPVPSQANVALVAWETSRIPSTDIHNQPRNNWVKQLNRMNQVWVPCTHNKKVLEECGVGVPVHVVHHPIDVRPFEAKVEPLFPKEKTTTFLSVFQWQPRKDPISLLLGFYNMKKPARLLLKTYLSDFQHGQGELITRIRDVKKNYHVPPPNTVSPILQQLSDEEMPQLYASADAIVSTSRGEGFCLPIVEAMAAGLMPIVTGGTAFDDFMRSGDFWEHNNGMQVGYSHQPVFGMGHIPWYSPDQEWMQINVSTLTECLDRAVEMHRQDTLKEWGRHAQKTVRELFLPEKIGAQMKELLRA